MTNASDIEIYISKLDLTAIKPWLEVHFSDVQNLNKKKGMPKNANPMNVTWQGKSIFVLIFEDVVANYTSIWFDSSSLPWPDDARCAKEAAKFFNKPVRYTAGSWQQQENPDAWIEVNPDQAVTQILWKT